MFILIVLASPFCTRSFAGEVQNVCARTPLPPIELEYRDNKANLEKIKKANLGKSELATFLKTEYAKMNRKTTWSALAATANPRFQPESPLRNEFLKYASKESRLADPGSYRSALISSYIDLLPEDDRLMWFLNLQDSKLSGTVLRAATKEETMNDVYGAVVNTVEVEGKKPRLEIVVSNNESEPLPYMLTLLAHELQHARRSVLEPTRKDEKEDDRNQIVDEAKAFDIQMRTYITLANKNPQIFCNWLYETWAYGNLLVPLSWTFASMEKELKSGAFMLNYAQVGMYKNKPHLLSVDKKALHPEIQKKIKALNLQYVK